MIERLKINHFSTSPSAIRQLMKHGNQHVLKYDLSSLKTIGTGISACYTVIVTYRIHIFVVQVCFHLLDLLPGFLHSLIVFS